MLKRTHKVALMAVLTVVMVLAFAGVALAQWTDMSLSVVGPYGITEAQVGQISQGFADGSWRPYNDMPRNQFVKMAVDAYKIPLVSPATPTYTDVPTTDYYFAYIEGATAAGLTNGVGGGKFEPNAIVTREQAAAIIVRWVADKNGYDLATYYTDAEAAAIIAAFPDAAQVGPSLAKEMAFAIDFGIIWGTNTGTLAPKGMLSRIQGAAMLIRSWGILPYEPPATPPAKIELVGADKSENLIGLAHTVTFKVTDAAGAPVAGALVDFDTLMAGYYYVGNISPSSGLTDAAGLASCILLSTEPGTERMSATVMTPAGPKTVMTTKYWVVLDEVYIVDQTRTAQNNVGTTHDWEARVVIFGPGPLSTSAQDWYNAVSMTADPTKPPMEMDGVDWPLGWVVSLLNQFYQNLLPVPGSDDWGDFVDQGEDFIDAWIDAHQDLIDSVDPSGPADFATLLNSLLAVDRWSWNTEQLAMGHGYKPRTMAGVPVTWTITPVSTTVPSVGMISAVQFTGTIAADKKSAVGFTNADGLTSIAIDSTTTGQTNVMAVADYAGNPYPAKLFNHLTSQIQLHFLDWDDQPLPQATAVKTWIPHVIGDTTSPITPAYQIANLGEEKILTITLKDSYGNPIAGREVEWFMQGSGFFQTDDGGDSSDPFAAANNKDFDVTDSNGQATVFVKSYESGEQIVHAKVRDKGTGGNEGTFITYDAEVQWFDVDVATFDNPATDDNEALSSNPVGDTHTFDMWVYGLKLEYNPNIDDPDDMTPWIDGDTAGSAYDGIIDAKDAAYFGGILLVDDGMDIQGWARDFDGDGVIENNANERGTATVVIAGRTLTLSLVGGYTEYDWDDDGFKEDFEGYTGIYLPLAGKTVTFDMANETDEDLSNLGAMFDGSDVDAVGTFTPASAITNAAGMVSVQVTSDAKGPQTISGTVDWAGNPHNGPELVTAYAKKAWVAGEVDAASTLKIEVWIDGVKVATKEDGELADGKSVAWIVDPDTGELVLNSAHVEVHVMDQYGNDLPDYEVVYLLEGIDGWLEGSQGAVNTYIPWAYLDDIDTENDFDTDTNYDQNGTRPDADEPTPESDPYAYIVGDGGTESFYFNQWLGSEKPTDDGQPGLGQWPLGRMPYAPFDAYSFPAWDMADVLDSLYGYGDDANAIFDGFDGVLDDAAPEDVGLATDGAKAWTLDGYYNIGTIDEPVIEPNLLTGSNIDIQLAMNPAVVEDADHFKSILRVMVYAPADGVVVGGSYLWSTQVHQVWEIPAISEVVITPADAVNAYTADHTMTVTVLDQDGNPVPNALVTMAAETTEPETTDAAVTAFDGAGVDGNEYTTDANGEVTVVASIEDDTWGAVEFTATAVPGVDSPYWGDATGTANKYWAMEVDLQYGAGADTPLGILGPQDLYIPAGIDTALNGKTFVVHAVTADGTIIYGPGVVVYNNTLGNIVQTTRDFGNEGDQEIEIFINFTAPTSLTDDVPNWVWADDGVVE